MPTGIPMRHPLYGQVCELVAREAASVPTEVDVVIDGVVVRRIFERIDPDLCAVLTDPETGRLDYADPLNIEQAETPCPSCGEDYLTDVSDENCDVRWTGGHALPTCSGCGDEVPSPDEGWRHKRCHLIP